jgi:uncharacterized protein YdaU (DUF1376 family)
MTMAKKLPNFPMHVDDLLQDTTHLSTEELGAYLLLLLHMWKSCECKLRLDHTYLAGIARVSPRRWRFMRERLLPFFESFGGAQVGLWITHKRLAREWNYCVLFSSRQAERGRRGGVAAKMRRFELEQTLSRGAGRSASVAGAVATNAATNAASQREDDNNLCTSEGQAAPVDNLLHLPSESSDGRGAATALPTGAPPPSEGTRPRRVDHLLNTPFMQGKTPFMPRRGG